jgi:predicted ferric reductase
MAGGRAVRIALVAAVVALPLGLALTDRHLRDVPAALVVSTAAAALAVSALALQPLLAATGRIRRHRLLGGIALALVLAHIVGLALVSVEDTLFAMSPDGPTRARMALLATIALVLSVTLGLARGRLPFGPGTWRILHGYLAVVVIVLGFGHAILTDGALDAAGTVVLVALGAGALVLVGAAYVARARA